MRRERRVQRTRWQAGDAPRVLLLWLERLRRATQLDAVAHARLNAPIVVERQGERRLSLGSTVRRLPRDEERAKAEGLGGVFGWCG